MNKSKTNIVFENLRKTEHFTNFGNQKQHFTNLKNEYVSLSIIKTGNNIAFNFLNQ